MSDDLMLYVSHELFSVSDNKEFSKKQLRVSNPFFQESQFVSHPKDY